MKRRRRLPASRTQARAVKPEAPGLLARAAGLLAGIDKGTAIAAGRTVGVILVASGLGAGLGIRNTETKVAAAVDTLRVEQQETADTLRRAVSRGSGRFRGKLDTVTVRVRKLEDRTAALEREVARLARTGPVGPATSGAGPGVIGPPAPAGEASGTAKRSWWRIGGLR